MKLATGEAKDPLRALGSQAANLEHGVGVGRQTVGDALEATPSTAASAQPALTSSRWQLAPNEANCSTQRGEPRA